MGIAIYPCGDREVGDKTDVFILLLPGRRLHQTEFYFRFLFVKNKKLFKNQILTKVISKQKLEVEK